MLSPFFLLLLLLLPRSSLSLPTLTSTKPLDLPSFPNASFPYNLSAVYQGDWHYLNRSQLVDSGIYDSLPLKESTGTIEFNIRQATPASDDFLASERMLHLLEGSLLLFDGDYADTSTALRIHLLGLYVPETGKVVFITSCPVSVTDISDFVARLAPDDERLAERIQRHAYALCELPVPDEGDVEYSPMMANMFGQVKPLPDGYQLKPGDQRGGEYPAAADATWQKEAKRRFLDMEMDGFVVSHNTGLLLKFTSQAVRFDLLFSKMVHYLTVVVLLTSAQLYFLARQMRSSDSPARAGKVSLALIGMQALIDAYLCMLHLFEGVLLQPIFQNYAVVSFVEFVAFSLFEMRFMLLVWKAQRADLFAAGWEAVRRELGSLYARFYGALFFGILLIYRVPSLLPVLVFVMHSFFVPQIVHNFKHDTNRALNFEYVVSTTLTRLFFPLYIYACPNNFFVQQFPHFHINTTFAVVVALWVLLQSAVLLAQDRWHAKWFVPPQFLPPRFNYHTVPEDDVELSDTPCAICLTEFDEDDPVDSLMRTPCNHYFHTECLTRWMEQKLECPNCRAPIPPP